KWACRENSCPARLRFSPRYGTNPSRLGERERHQQDVGRGRSKQQAGNGSPWPGWLEVFLAVPFPKVSTISETQASRCHIFLDRRQQPRYPAALKHPVRCWRIVMPSAHSSADENLLFGILALQIDFINRDQLVAAMNAWVLQKHKALGDILQEQGALDAEQNA